MDCGRDVARVTAHSAGTGLCSCGPRPSLPKAEPPACCPVPLPPSAFPAGRAGGLGLSDGVEVAVTSTIALEPAHVSAAQLHLTVSGSSLLCETTAAGAGRAELGDLQLHPRGHCLWKALRFAAPLLSLTRGSSSARERFPGVAALCPRCSGAMLHTSVGAKEAGHLALPQMLTGSANPVA